MFTPDQLAAEALRIDSRLAKTAAQPAENVRLPRSPPGATGLRTRSTTSSREGL